VHIVFDSVTVRLGDVLVIHDLSMAVEAGKITALTGPSGSGKTTTLGLIAGTSKPTAGSVRLQSPDGRFRSPSERFVAWVPQGSQMLPGRTVFDNAMIGALADGHTVEVASGKAADALHLVGLTPLSARAGKTLSGGEAQRLAFARAIATSRPILLADEPTANLDRHNAAQVIETLARLSSSRLIVVATHDPEVATSASTVVQLAAPMRSND
jgi:putative ABC transport system ATP-binding protein